MISTTGLTHWVMIMQSVGPVPAQHHLTLTQPLQPSTRSKRQLRNSRQGSPQALIGLLRRCYVLAVTWWQLHCIRYSVECGRMRSCHRRGRMQQLCQYARKRANKNAPTTASRQEGTLVGHQITDQRSPGRANKGTAGQILWWCGCVDQIFCLHQVFERRIRSDQKFVAIFIDFSAAFDSVHHESMWKAMLVDGISAKMVKILCNYYEGAECSVRVHGKITPTATMSPPVFDRPASCPRWFLILSLTSSWIVLVLLHLLSARICHCKTWTKPMTSHFWLTPSKLVIYS